MIIELKNMNAINKKKEYRLNTYSHDTHRPSRHLLLIKRPAERE
jgi:hypothetical protein